MLSCGGNEKTSAHVNQNQPILGYRTANILEVKGLKFKDLNQNSQLDAYEDWRLTSEERSADLVTKLSLEQKAGLIFISSTRLENDWSFESSKETGDIGSGFNEEDLAMSINIFNRKLLLYPMMVAAATTKAVT